MLLLHSNKTYFSSIQTKHTSPPFKQNILLLHSNKTYFFSIQTKHTSSPSKQNILLRSNNWIIIFRDIFVVYSETHKINIALSQCD
jgi:hypothetical protein